VSSGVDVGVSSTYKSHQISYILWWYIMYLMKPEDFEPWVGRKVRVQAIPTPVEVTLVRLERKPIFRGSEREPFSLFFESDENIVLLDLAYEFDCGRGGPYSILIAQLKPKPGRRVYQAVFN